LHLVISSKSGKFTPAAHTVEWLWDRFEKSQDRPMQLLAVQWSWPPLASGQGKPDGAAIAEYGCHCEVSSSIVVKTDVKTDQTSVLGVMKSHLSKL
jgi:hypothetical protein